MKNKTIVIILIILLIVILGVTILVSNKKQEEQQQAETEKIEEIKNETGATADTNIYEIGTDFDGREVLYVKAEVQMQTVWAGIDKGRYTNRRRNFFSLGRYTN